MPFQLKLATEQAICTLQYLARNNKRTGTGEIAGAMNVSANYLSATIAKLRDAGILETFGGCNGGCRLMKPIESISLYDVVIAMEQQIAISRCMEKDARVCKGCVQPDCGVRAAFDVLQKGLIEQLKLTTIADLVSQK